MLNPTRTNHVRLLTCVLGASMGIASARADLVESQVLVVYDSRIADSLAIAEHYAGSAKVPGGTGTEAGVHRRVHVLDISTQTTNASTPAGVFPAAADISYATFKQQLRDPLRVYMYTTQLNKNIRSIVLTKGLPHRVLDQGTNPTLGDNPGMVNNEINAGRLGNFTYCSVDAELSLVLQALDTGEANAVADSKCDGGINNPYWNKPFSISGYSTRNNYAAKTYTLPGSGANGIFWINGTNQNLATTLTPGDIFLVCRLDGHTVTDVNAMVDRAQNIVAATDNSLFILDADGTGHDADTVSSGFQAPTTGDYTLSDTLLTSDKRYLSSNVLFNNAPNFDQFYVGPQISYAGTPLVASSSTLPVLYLSSFGANHTGVLAAAATTYVSSFFLAPGAGFSSLESYNGRNFGGLGQNPFASQQQCADAIAAGMTFACGNVWEPLSYSVADNEKIIRNFYLGRLSWAEAAYTSLPILSWQQIVLGDPLARLVRDREDINSDGRVDIDDLYAWQATPTDINRSGVADVADLAILEAMVRGGNNSGETPTAASVSNKNSGGELSRMKFRQR